MTRHILDLPADVDKVHLLCGPRLDQKSAKRGDLVSGEPAIANCVACLRAHAVKQGLEITRMQKAATHHADVESMLIARIRRYCERNSVADSRRILDMLDHPTDPGD